MSVEWATCNKGQWCPLADTDLTDIEAFGVYVIWVDHKVMGMYRAVRVGKGVIKDRIQDHLDDEQITHYKQYGPMYVTWASMPANLVDGAEAYLADRYKPLVGSRFPDAPHVILNLPWEPK